MIGIVIVTHGNLAKEFISVTEHVIGKPQEDMVGVCIAPDDGVDHIRNSIEKAIKSVYHEEGVIVLTDMFGGTPANLAISLTGKYKIEVLAGINLPALIKLAQIRNNKNLKDAVLLAREAGIKYMKATCDFFEFV